MTHKTFASLLLLAVCNSVHAEPLRQWDSPDVAAFAAYASEVAFNKGKGGLNVRIHTFPLTLGECWGKIDSCPDIELSISVSAGDLYEKPIVLRLPSSKGWEFIRWLDKKSANGKESQIGFALRTTIPGTNIEQAERDKFKSKYFEVWVSETGGSYEFR